MLKFEIDGGELRELKAAGTTPDITIDVTALIRIIYDSLEDQAGEMFKDILLRLLTDPESPMWKPMQKKDGVKGVHIHFPFFGGGRK